MADKWEYLILRINNSQYGYVPRWENGREIKGWDKGEITLPGYINYLGEQGWELVVSYQALDSFIFKRPRQK